MTAVLFTFAAMAGALVRVALRDRFGPTATITVNLLGSFLLGLATAGGLGDDATTIVGTGFCGSLTTMTALVAESSGTNQGIRVSVKVMTHLSWGVFATVFATVIIRWCQ